MEEMAPVGDFPGGPVGKTTCLQCRGHGFHSCSGNQDPTRPHGVEMAVVMVGSPPPLLHPSPLDQVSGQGSLRPMATKMLPGWLLWLVCLALATWLPKCVSGRVGGGGLRFLGHREASRAGLLIGLGPFLLGPDPSVQISSLWGGEWQARQGREEGEHIPWQLIVSDAGLACCRTPKQGGQGLCLPGLPRLRGWRWETLKSLL